MSEFTVKTGSINVKVEAETHKEAARKAFDSAAAGDTAEHFVSTKRKGEPTMWHLTEWYVDLLGPETPMLSLHRIICKCDRCVRFRGDETTPDPNPANGNGIQQCLLKVERWTQWLFL